MNDSTVKFLIGVITSWQLITLVIILLLLKPIRALVSGINNLKVGSFQLSLQKIGESLGVPNSVSDIGRLNYDDLKIFLIICGEDSDYYSFQPWNMPAAKFKAILDKLDNNELIKLTDPPPPPKDDKTKPAADPDQPPVWHFVTTPKGRKVHRALLDSIYEQMLHTKTGKK